MALALAVEGGLGAGDRLVGGLSLAVESADPGRECRQASLERLDAVVGGLQAMALDEEKERLVAQLPSLAEAEKDGVTARIRELQEERAALSKHFSRVGPRLKP